MCSTTKASTKLSTFLRDVMKVLKYKVDENYIKTVYRRCWFVMSADDAFRDIKHNIHSLTERTPRTFDFTTMYTQLQHDIIVTNVRNAVEEAIAFKSLCRNDSLPTLESVNIIITYVQFTFSNTFLYSNTNFL
jgi:hypothetical protein